MWPWPCSHTLLQPWLCSRGDLPIAFRGTVIFSATFPSLTASPLSFVAVLTRSSCPIVPMMQSTLPNTPRTSILLLPQPRRSVAPLGTSSTSCKRLPHRLCVAVKFGVCVCECGKVTALRHLPTTASSLLCRDAGISAAFVLRQWCFGRLQVARAPRSAYVCITYCCSFASRFDPAGFHSLKFILRRKVMAYRGTARAGVHSVFLAVSVPCNDAITLAFAAIRSQCHFVAV